MAVEAATSFSVLYKSIKLKYFRSSAGKKMPAEIAEKLRNETKPQNRPWFLHV